MNKAKTQAEFATLEHVSFTFSQMNKDTSGKQIVNRTYWSIRKKINQPNENYSNLMHRDSKMTGKSTSRAKRQEQKPAKKPTQLSLFPLAEQ